ncbi:hypothetical protein CW354_06055 [Marinicaulis flavus]|uniref:VPLPA-CTERM sorting domain-containing protein n=1 Tax=Hyphococcus luteus TaxID=2058213 RepID=A0A2S7K5Y1_9PROT|nr:hypothetical protein CW354_06055 [Marinicaulis flavus]
MFFALAMFSAAHAAPITFTHEATSGGGTLDGAAFDGGAIVITAAADTDDIVDVGGGTYAVEHLAASIAIDGLGVFDFISPTRTFVNNGFVGFSRSANGGLNGADLLNGPAGLGAYDLTTSIGPSTGGGNFLQWAVSAVLTDGGVLEFASVGTDITFTAVVGDVSDVPLPAAFPLFLAGLGGLGFLRGRKKAA